MICGLPQIVPGLGRIEIIFLPPRDPILTKLADASLYEGQPDPMPIAKLVQRWGVFISHATKDKDDIVVPLA
jgi:hypothetical protein